MGEYSPGLMGELERELGLEPGSLNPAGAKPTDISKSPDTMTGGDGYIYQYIPGAGWMPIQSPLTGNYITAKPTGSGGGGGMSISDIGPNSIAIRQQEMAQAAAQAQADLAQRAQLQREQQGFNTGERRGSEAFSAGQSELMRQFNAAQQAQSLNAQGQLARDQMSYSGQNSALDRSAAATQYALGLIQRQQEQAQQAQRDYQDQKRGLGQDRLAAARQFADVVSSVDPAALPAFYAAGGGNIMNSLNTGATALSDNAIRPGAEALDTSKQINQQLVDLRPYNVPISSLESLMAGFAPYLRAPDMPTSNGLAPGFVHNGYPGGWNPGAAAGGGGGGGGGGGQNYAGQYGAGTWSSGNANTGFVGSVDAGGNLVATPMAAQGGMFQNAVIVGDSPSGGRGENPELVQSSGPIQVTPLDRMPNNGRDLFSVLPAAAEGGLYGGWLHGGKAPNLQDWDQPAAAGGGLYSTYAPGNTNLNNPAYRVASDPTYGTANYLGDAPGGRVETQAEYQARLASVAARNAPMYGIGGTMNVTPAAPLPETAVTQGAQTAGPDIVRSMQEVRDIRGAVDTTDPLGVGLYNTRFSFLPPSLMQRYFASLQSKYGVPAMDVAAESRNYALQGLGAGRNAMFAL